MSEIDIESFFGTGNDDDDVGGDDEARDALRENAAVVEAEDEIGLDSLGVGGIGAAPNYTPEQLAHLVEVRRSQKGAPQASRKLATQMRARMAARASQKAVERPKDP